jgi:hypothetical protein
VTRGQRGAAAAVVVVATLLSLTLALRTRGFIHPDERIHMEALHYFSSHWWLPDLNSDSLVYDAFGASKVYAREVSYLILGRLGLILDASVGGPPWRAFRLVNVALLPLTLVVLFWVRSSLVPTPALAMVLACVPQVLYLFAYANSDAFAVCVSVLLFAQALRLARREVPWPMGECATLGVLLGLCLGAKDNFLFALAFPAVILLPRLAAGIGARRLLLIALLAAAIPLPYKVLYPLSQPEFSEATWRQAEERAQPGFKPSDPSRAGLPPPDHGAWQVLTKDAFAWRTAQSFWGVYGHMKVFDAPGVYLSVALLALANFGLTLETAIRRWASLHASRRRLFVVAPLVLAANLALSLRWSMAIFYQPQGRYLFPSLLPVAFLLVGTADLESRSRQRLRLASATAAMLLCVWSLLFVALPRLSS